MQALQLAEYLHTRPLRIQCPWKRRNAPLSLTDEQANNIRSISIDNGPRFPGWIA